MKFAPELPRRRFLAQERKNLIDNEGEGYAAHLGEYRQGLYVDDTVHMYTGRPEQLCGTEHALAEEFITYPDKLAERGIHRPAIFLDFGGMVGLSAMRIAAQPIMQEKIKQGNIVIAVSNLGYDLSRQAVPSIKKELTYLDQAEVEFIEKYRGAIHYLKGDASTLLRSSITLPDGRQIPLRGNVDLLHEYLALAHGFKNDLDIPRLGKLISPVGQLWLGTKSFQMMQAADFAHRHDMAMVETRNQAHQQGVANLAELGLQPKPTTRPIRYQIFQHT